MCGKVDKLCEIKFGTALKIKANEDFEDIDENGKPVLRIAGEQWLITGPATYVPNVHSDIIDTCNAQIIAYNTALKLQANKDTKDHKGNLRKAGEKWLVRD